LLFLLFSFFFFTFYYYYFQDFPEGTDESSCNYISPTDPLSPPCYSNMAPPCDAHSPDAYMHSGRRYPSTPVPSPPSTPHSTLTPPLSCPQQLGSLNCKPRPPGLSPSPPHAEELPVEPDNIMHYHSLPQWAGRMDSFKCKISRIISEYEIMYVWVF